MRLARIAFDAFWKHEGGGPNWNSLPDSVKGSWEAAALAVANAVHEKTGGGATTQDADPPPPEGGGGNNDGGG